MKIDSKIKKPAKPVRNRYPWAKMKVGQSFLVESPMTFNSMRSTVANRNAAFEEQYEAHKEEGGTRVFRVK